MLLSSTEYLRDMSDDELDNNLQITKLNRNSDSMIASIRLYDRVPVVWIE